ncbi:MAG TPA: AraC family transcriptional regulator [Burkholderiaceae bacterium]
MNDTLQPVTTKAKGVVAPALAGKMFRLNRYQPAAPFDSAIEHYWVVQWDLQGKPPFVQRTLPYPSVQLVFDQCKTAVFGVVSGAFEYSLQESGRVLGVRFKAGAFRAMLGRSLQTITDKTLTVAETFGWDDARAERQVLDAADDAGMVAAAETLLRPHLPPPDPKVEKITALLKHIQEHQDITRAEEWAAQCGMGLRSLQLLLADYVGVSPKWVIMRYRLQEAADLLASGADIDLAGLAQRLGYFDQAHFSRAFHALVGKTPSEYRKQNAGA